MQYKAGAFFGFVIGLLVFVFVPISSDFGQARIFPTGNAIIGSITYEQYVANLPFSMFIWISLEVLGVAIGIVAQRILSKS